MARKRLESTRGLQAVYRAWHLCGTAAILQVIVGLILLASALLKTVPLVESVDRSHTTLAFPAWVVYCMVTIEYALGAKLLIGPMSLVLWRVSLWLFVFFAGTSLYQGWNGAEACGCFGFLATSPWLTLALDVAIVFAILVCGPPLFMWAWTTLLHTTAIFLLRNCAVGAVIVIAVALFANGLQAHLSRSVHARGSTDLTLPSPLDMTVYSQLSPNLGILLASLGVFPGGEMQSRQDEGTVQGFLHDVINTFGLDGVTVAQVPAESLTSIREPIIFSCPYVAESADEHIFVLLGVVMDDGELYYQVIQGGAPPILVNKQLLDGAVSRIWKYNVESVNSRSRRIVFRAADIVLAFDQAYCNFGLVRAHGAEAASIQITNIGNCPVNFGGPSVSCGCTKAKFAGHQSSLAVGESAELKINIDVPSSNVRHRVTIPIAGATASEIKRVDIELLGSQLQTFRVTPGSLDFGTVRRGEELHRTVRLSEVASDRFEITGIDVGSLPLSWSIESKLQSNRFHRDFIVGFSLETNKLPPGEYSESIKVHTSSERVPVVEVPVRITVPSSIAVRPPTLAFGVVKRGVTARRIASLELPSFESECSVVIEPGETGPFMPKVVRRSNGQYDIVIDCIGNRPGEMSSSLSVLVCTPSGSETVTLRCVAFVR